MTILSIISWYVYVAVVDYDFSFVFVDECLWYQQGPVIYYDLTAMVLNIESSSGSNSSMFHLCSVHCWWSLHCSGSHDQPFWMSTFLLTF